MWAEDPMALYLHVIKDRYINDRNDKTLRKFLGEE
jgi:hypothetical protein